jgi:dual-specificity kinase
VTLGLKWSHSVDLWSMGCILVELWTGTLLFSTHDEVWNRAAHLPNLAGGTPRAECSAPLPRDAAFLVGKAPF